MSCFFPFFTFWRKNVKNEYFNQNLKCAAPKGFSKYTTLTIWSICGWEWKMLFYRNDGWNQILVLYSYFFLQWKLGSVRVRRLMRPQIRFCATLPWNFITLVNIYEMDQDWNLTLDTNSYVIGWNVGSCNGAYPFSFSLSWLVWV